jgi:hypothetical protein
MSMKTLERFTQAPNPQFLAKLNAIVDAVNDLANIRGDEAFINVRRGPGGAIVTLNIAAVDARMPRVGGGGGATREDGTTSGDMEYWNGTDWVLVPAASASQYMVPQIQGDGTVAYDWVRAH